MADQICLGRRSMPVAARDSSRSGRGQEVQQLSSGVCVRGGTYGEVEVDVALELHRERTNENNVRGGSEDGGYRNNCQLGFATSHAGRRLPSNIGTSFGFTSAASPSRSSRPVK